MSEWLFPVIQPLAFLASLYICGCAVIRLRYSRHMISMGWVVMYVFVFALAALSAALQLTPMPKGDWLFDVVRALNSATSIAVAFYLRLTAEAWRDGIPPICQSRWAELR